ncbi:hypothetical protein EDI_024120 [Entamoeba dispar SAW760]|uniref:Uncharacterized protein n=1 Tax=Entamoeba dispar (strain ATCC PRA-260 / SAW760) TaxID=370354 RepID=B0EH76_ENTDS|nr:uncharacterized protein EDI_024120 [Entamoeba dispar SAW760]EDR26128.1 hypothetical protein EDI_024120 [Entamoeba dispar SAW760]|eukprot:EDR26128.1 hypothetical protein EDI_024120 [Entamoeba dispar SAW760]
MPYTKEKVPIQNPQENAIVISFSIHYITQYGQELYVNLDDYTCKFVFFLFKPFYFRIFLMYRKLTWTSGHIWKGTITLVRPRTLKWSYSLLCGEIVLRREELKYPRVYSLDDIHKYYHIYDRWDNPQSSVSPLTFGSLPVNDEKTFSSNNDGGYFSPRSSRYITSIYVTQKKVKDTNSDDEN